MLKRQLLPKPKARPPIAPQPDIGKIAKNSFARLPHVVATRKQWQDLHALREWWVVLLPLLAWVGWRTYRKERRIVNAIKAKHPSPKRRRSGRRA